MRHGSNFGRPSTIETDYAQDLVELLPAAEMVKFAKNGAPIVERLNVAGIQMQGAIIAGQRFFVPR